MKPDAFNSRGRFGRYALVIMAGAALTLGGCTDSLLPYTPIYTHRAPAPDGWVPLPGANDPMPLGAGSRPAPVLPPVNAPPPPSYSFVPHEQTVPVNTAPSPLRPVDPGPSPLRFLPSVTFLTPPADATDCTGWWRICHLY
jgi:hypothetical protein